MFVENAAAFFADFGVPCTLGGNAVVGIFDNGYSLGNVGSFSMSTTQPVLTVPTAQVPANPVGQAVVVAGQGYLVQEHQPDGTGISRLVLEAS